MTDIENKIKKVRTLSEYGVRMFEFAFINTQVKEEIEDFLKEPNSKNMFLLIMDLILPMAESFVVYENDLVKTFEKFPFLNKDIKRRIEKLESEKGDEK